MNTTLNVTETRLEQDPDSTGYLLVNGQLMKYHGTTATSFTHLRLVGPWEGRRHRAWWAMRRTWRHTGWWIACHLPEEQDATTWMRP